jgi:hypothetical protein
MKFLPEVLRRTIMAKGRSSGGRARSAISGLYISKVSAARRPRTSVVESSGRNGGSGKVYRSAISGRYVTKGTAQRSPNTTVTENG